MRVRNQIIVEQEVICIHVYAITHVKVVAKIFCRLVVSCAEARESEVLGGIAVVV
jgi:hypothetical protein